MQSTSDEIVLPETRPATEWILGRALQKVSPRRRHAVVQGAAATMLRAWARGRGQVGTEWHFRLAPGGEVRRPLVPDVAYVSLDRLRSLAAGERDIPPIAPEIALEIRSPGNLRGYFSHKRRVYFATGTLLVIVVDPKSRTVTVDDVDGFHAVFSGDEHATVPRYPDLSLPLGELFEDLDIPD